MIPYVNPLPFTSESNATCSKTFFKERDTSFTCSTSRALNTNSYPVCCRKFSITFANVTCFKSILTLGADWPHTRVLALNKNPPIRKIVCNRKINFLFGFVPNHFRRFFFIILFLNLFIELIQHKARDVCSISCFFYCRDIITFFPSILYFIFPVNVTLSNTSSSVLLRSTYI